MCVCVCGERREVSVSQAGKETAMAHSAHGKQRDRESLAEPPHPPFSLLSGGCSLAHLLCTATRMQLPEHSLTPHAWLPLESDGWPAGTQHTRQRDVRKGVEAIEVR